MFGFEPADLGTHSTRKGVATFVSAGCTVGPPVASICIRAGWSMGGVRDKYMKYEAAGDQFVGRCASCLDLLSKEFAISPPYWDFSRSYKAEELVLKQELEKFLKDRLLNYSKIHPKTLELVRTILASVFFHYDFLKENLSPMHAFRASSIFRNIPDTLKACAKVAFPWTKSSYTPMLTGVPPHTMIIAELESLKMSISESRRSLKQDLRDVMLELEPARSTETQTMILLQDVAEKVNRLSLQYSGSQGSQSNADDSVMGGIDNWDFVDEQDVVYHGVLPPSEDPEQERIRMRDINAKAKKVVENRKWKVGYHNNKLQILPPTWKLPSMTCSQLVVNWLTGDLKANVPPLSRLKAHDVKHLGKTIVVNLRMMRLFMTVVQSIATGRGVWPQRCTSIADANKVWEIVGPIVVAKYGNPNQIRQVEINWKTFYNQMCDKGAFKK